MNETTQPAVAGPVEPTVTRRYGRFTMPAAWAREGRAEIKRVMAQCIVFRAEQMFHSDSIEYWASSEHFRHVPAGEIVPEYSWRFNADGSILCQELNV